MEDNEALIPLSSTKSTRPYSANSTVIGTLLEPPITLISSNHPACYKLSTRICAEDELGA